MSADRDSDDAPSERETRPFATEPLGEVNVRLEIDAETYQRARAAYVRASRAGYEDEFALFVYNRCTIGEETVTVDGEPVEDVLDEQQ